MASGVILLPGIVRAVALNRVMIFFFFCGQVAEGCEKGVRGNEN